MDNSKSECRSDGKSSTDKLTIYGNFDGKLQSIKKIKRFHPSNEISVGEFATLLKVDHLNIAKMLTLIEHRDYR